MGHEATVLVKPNYSFKRCDGPRSYHAVRGSLTQALGATSDI